MPSTSDLGQMRKNALQHYLFEPPFACSQRQPLGKQIILACRQGSPTWPIEQGQIERDTYRAGDEIILSSGNARAIASSIMHGFSSTHAARS